MSRVETQVDFQYQSRVQRVIIYLYALNLELGTSFPFYIAFCCSAGTNQVMWIFGYGSLVWKADFPYIKKVVGYVKGFERKFYQASIDHRGTPDQPGRVVTLIPSADPNTKVWGVVYKIHRRDVESVLKQLDMREATGYERVPAEFFPVPNHALNIFDIEPQHLNQISVINPSDCKFNNSSPTLVVPFADSNCGDHGNGSDSGRSSFISDEIRSKGDESDIDCSNMSSDDDDFDVTYDSVREGQPFFATMYFAAECNEHFIGSASLDQMALQIFKCSGASGQNRDYLFNLAHSMREICTEALDTHLMELEVAVRLLESF